LAALAAFGVSAEQIATVRKVIEARNARATLAVWPENWHAVMLFCDLSSQWRAVAGMVRIVWLGLDYAAITPTVLKACRRSIPRAHRRPEHRLMPQLRTLEKAATNWRNEAK
jgi:hypothetical protein